ncbi:peptidase M14 [Lacihabitans sp. CCS-44]|uniref:M14 family zinc carboxypeptidase n=1 Tax=Lacihabitans sp. CCS-44 TaxID=2487331 RepID=UPI0020CDAFDA|nr:M14 family zinc carboxypeptidase [Lacihabitans sp. CCS-44]MCP9756389.1 peptidase M14 [Lacihabitans sp. CCS-44]
MIYQKLFDKYINFIEPSLQKRRFKHQDIVGLINASPFEKEIVGLSFEEREIYKIKVGQGKRKILLWSQMHGNEATATMAIFDILNFLKPQDDDFQDFRNEILNKLQLNFVPMLNPDGAERFIRRTAQGIDMNRDAVALQCPESKILKSLVFDLQPEFSFNLHDQNIRYSAGISSEQATISFLATAYNQETEWNEVRTKSRQVISAMNEVLKNFIPNNIGRFSDEFEPRAFGDNIQKWGSSLILIESGGYKDDTEKQFIRKLNFVSILSAFEAILNDDYQKYTLEDYQQIPQNEKYLFDLKIINAKIKLGNTDFDVDLGVNFEEKNILGASEFTHKSVIEDMGDLSVFWGIKTLDAKGGFLRPFSDFPEIANKLGVYKNFQIEEGEEAYFVIDQGHHQTAIFNGKVVE